MDKKQRIVEIIAAEPFGAEGLRWAAWLCWEEFGSDFRTDREPHGMNSSEFADAAETLGVKRGTAMNRYSDARRNWVASFN